MRDTMIFGKWYKLRTWDGFGNLEQEEEWIDAYWDGKSLLDSDGMTWTEWLDTPEDVKRGEGTGCWSRDGMERLAPRVAIGLVEDLVFILPPAPAPPTPTGP